MKQSVYERFWSRVLPTEGCWIWIGHVTSGGYGEIMVSAKESPRKDYVHRWVYQELVGAIPKELQIDHLCRNRRCVYPAHLELVTSRQNTLRGNAPAAANAHKSHCLRGHPLSGDNLYLSPSGGRRCRICKNTMYRLRWRRQHWGSETR